MDKQNSKKDFEFVNCGPATIKTEAEDEENVLQGSENACFSLDTSPFKSEHVYLKDELLEISSNNNSVVQLHGADQEAQDGSDSEEAADWAPVSCEVQIDEADTDLIFKPETDVDLQLKNVNSNTTIPSTSQEFATPRFEGIQELLESHWNKKRKKQYWENDTSELEVRQSNRKNTNQGRYLCGFCPYKGADSYRLTIHLRTHTGDKPFKCKLCNYQSTQKSALTVHVKRHMGLKAYECSICSMRYAHKRSLDMHIMKHTGGENPFKCEECSYSTASAHHLTLHKRTHSGEKPFACDKCPYKFAALPNLKSHMKIHTGQLISCPHCSYKCVQPRDLKRHVRKHSGELFDCVLCDYHALSKAEVKMHMKKHTGETSKHDKISSNRSDNNLRNTLGRTRVRRSVKR